jgi:phosphonate transport system substrate-binding protein
MHRRRFLQSSCATAGLFLAGKVTAAPSTGQREISIGLTPVFLDHQLEFLKQLRSYFSERLSTPVRFVQRGSYREIIDLIRGSKLDFAWVCGYPYVRFRREMRLLAVPLYFGNPLYQSYLISARSDNTTKSLLDLRGKTFAYSDPDSNSGYLVPQYQLLRAGENPATFFTRSFFTWGHRKIIEAVGIGLAQGGAVDGYVWDTLEGVLPELTATTRIVSRSPELGFPPFVARSDIGDEFFRHMQRMLLGMSNDAQGARLLKTLNLDGFVPGSDALYDGIATMARTLDRFRK